MKLYRYEEYYEKVGQIYQQIRNEVSQLIPDARIEHIGSSSIPGSVSKGDLDIFLGVNSNQFKEVLGVLDRIGFTEKMGTFRSNELCMLETERFSYDVAIQVVVNGSQFEDFLLFRNLLLSDNDLVEKYNQIKVSSQHLPPDLYRAKKSQFIEKVLETSHKL